jgi:hypothetical protein
VYSKRAPDRVGKLSDLNGLAQDCRAGGSFERGHIGIAAGEHDRQARLDAVQRLTASVKEEVQKAQRRAAIGTSLRHSGHFLVVGSGAASPRRIRARILFTGSTMKKYTAAPMRMNETMH